MQIKREAIDQQLCSSDAAGILVPFPDSLLQKWKRKGQRIDNIQELERNMEYIKEQYIFHDAEHSLNISGNTRVRILSADLKLREEKARRMMGILAEVYLQMFDVAMSEVMQLIRTDSLPR